MRLYILPVSTKRSLLYAHRLNTTTATNASLHDRLVQRASAMWSSWEAKDGGWQKHAVVYGNKLLRHIPMEEWSLKSIPLLSPALKNLKTLEEKKALESVEVVYPAITMQKTEVPQVLKRLATERETLHRRRLFWCCVGMPVAVPFAIVPVIPNFPLFYLVYRAWSHWKAIAGSKHVQFLLNNNLLSYRESMQLDAAYEPTTAQKVVGKIPPERLLLKQNGVETLTQTLAIPELQSELERAVFQVEQSIAKEATKADSTTGQAVVEYVKEFTDEKKSPTIATALENQMLVQNEADVNFVHRKKHWKEERDTHGKDKKEKHWKGEKYDKKAAKDKTYAKEKEFKKGEKLEKQKLYA